VESGQKIVVGVNKFRDEETSTPPLQRIDPRVNGASAIASRRSGRSVTRRPGSPLSPTRGLRAGRREPDAAIIEAVQAYATVGEICDRLRGVWASTVS